jgi:hypothetical protein
MEQKQSKQRNIKTLSTKSEPVVEKMVLKAESVVEVKNKKAEVVETKSTKVSNTQVGAATKTQVAATTTAQVAATTTAQVAATTTTQVGAAKTSKSKKTEVTPATPATQATPATPATQATQATPAKSKRVVQKAVIETKEVVATPIKTSKTSKTSKTVKKAGVADVQTAGAKTVKTVKTVKTAKKTVEPVIKASKKVNVEEAIEENKQDDKLRYFKLYYNENICGRYSGKKPKQAANKAFSSIVKDMKKTENKEGVNIDISFTIKECTRNSFHKEYKYIGKRLLLKSPVKVTIENGDGTSKDIVYKYHNELKKAPKL